MAVTPNALGRRYAPLLALAAVQILLVVLAPSIASSNKGGGVTGLTAGSNGTGISGGGSSGQAGSVSGTGGANGTGAGGGVGGGGTGGGGAGGSLSGTGTSGGTGSSGVGGGGAVPGTGTSGGIGYTSTDRSHSAANGQEVGPTYYMPVCVPVWHGGNNGGNTMTGVTATQINYVFYVGQGNPEVNAILNEEGLAATASQVCHALQAFTTELNKRYEMYGRKLVSLDGPGSGNHAGSAQQSDCHFPYFQGQCTLTPPDLPCATAEAKVIAAMHPAFVVAPVAFDTLLAGLGQAGIVTMGGSASTENIPESYFDQLAPYFYNVFPSVTQTAEQVADFYCKKLSGHPVQFAGPEVQTLNGALAPPPVRKLAIIYPINNGDPAVKDGADQLAHLVDGGECGSAKSGTQEFSYASDINTAQSQSETTVAGLKAGKITTVVCICDPIAPVFLSNTMEQQNYHPEIVVPGSGLLDYDVLAQLYNQDVWRHAFGPSDIGDAIPFGQSDAVKAWDDAGASGVPDNTENLNWGYFTFLGASIQNAGPDLTPATIRTGLSNAPPLGGTPTEPLVAARGAFPWTEIKDQREVFFCPTDSSPINGHPGAYRVANGGARYQLGQFPSGTAELFTGGLCAP